ncbi:MAG TPA: SRPBCC family protein [Pirellulales bacterium]|jgi:hypothetical protein
MLKKSILGVGLVLSGLVALFCLVVVLQPSGFSVERSTTMNAPPGRAFEQVNDLALWDAWSPWSKLDPNATTSLSQPSAGKGATFDWAGNADIGEGTLTIVDSRPNERVEVEQVFVKPFAGKANFTFVFAPADGGTRLLWKMEGQNDFMGKAMCLFMDLDSMLGKDFEQGLANLKAIAEGSQVEEAAAERAEEPASEGSKS